MEYKIVEYGCLKEYQRKQAVELFMEGFGHMMIILLKGYPIRMRKECKERSDV